MSDELANKDNFQVVFSFKMAESLCADFPFFNNLIAVKRSKRDVKRRVWIFKKTPEFSEVFEQLKAEAIKARKQRENDLNAFDKDDCTSVGAQNDI